MSEQSLIEMLEEEAMFDGRDYLSIPLDKCIAIVRQHAAAQGDVVERIALRLRKGFGPLSCSIEEFYPLAWEVTAIAAMGERANLVSAAGDTSSPASNVDELRHALAVAALPLEAIRAGGTDTLHTPEVQEAISAAIEAIRGALQVNRGDAATRKDAEVNRENELNLFSSVNDGTSPAKCTRSSAGLEQGASTSCVAGSSPAGYSNPSDGCCDTDPHRCAGMCDTTSPTSNTEHAKPDDHDTRGRMMAEAFAGVHSNQMLDRESAPAPVLNPDLVSREISDVARDAACIAGFEAWMDSSINRNWSDEIIDKALAAYEQSRKPEPVMSGDALKRAYVHARAIYQLTPEDLERHGGYEVVNDCIGHAREIMTELEAAGVNYE